MPTAPSETIAGIRNRIASAIGNSRNVVQTVADTVAELLTAALKDGETPGASAPNPIASVVTGAVQGAAQVRADLGQAAKGIMIGVLFRAQATRQSVSDSISQTADITLRNVAEFGGDMAATSAALIAGAGEGARGTGIVPDDARAAAALGVLKAAAEIGPMTVDKVREALGWPIQDTKGRVETASL